MPDLSLRETIEQAMNPAATEETPADVPEDLKETGAEVAEAEPEKDEEAPEEAEEAEEVEEEGDDEEEAEEPVEARAEDIPKPPAALKGDLKAKWAELPPEVRNEFIRLEQTQAKGVQKIAEDANYGRSLKQVIQPYEAMLRAEGASPEKAVASLLNTAYQLRSASPAQKQVLFSNLARQYGVDVKGLAEGQPQIDPNISRLDQRLSQFEQQQMQQQHAQQQAQEGALMSGIEAFAHSPENEHFDSVQDAVVRLVQPFGPGEAITPEAVQERLRKAYDQACWAVPEIRQQILNKQRAKEEADRKAATKADVRKKKVAGSSLKGGTAKSSAGKISSDMSLREMIEAQVRGEAERI